MASGIRLFKVLGIRISIDYTWFIVFALVAWNLAAYYFPMKTPGLSWQAYVLMGAASSLLLFVCVVIHELSHSYTSNRLGLDVSEITLFIFGGVAKLSREPDDAKTELKIAAAGPLASVALFAAFTLLKGFIDPASTPALAGVIGFLAYINIALAVFNMIPGFPLDGGRVLRAIWWAKTGDLRKATLIASRIGKGFAVFLIVFGFLQIIAGAFISGLWGILIGTFLQQAAEGSYRQLIMKMALEGVKVEGIMTRNVVTMDEGVTLLKAVEDYFFHFHFVSFPVMSGGNVVGLFTLSHVRGVAKEKWSTTHVGDVMDGLTPEKILSPDDSVTHVLARMASDNTGRYPVLDKGKLVGILSRRDVMKLMELKVELAH